MKEDVDLFLLRQNSKEIEPNLSSYNKKNLKSFLKNFNTFEESLDSNAKLLNTFYRWDPKDLLYSHMYSNRLFFGKRKFFAIHGSSIDEVKNKISIGYRNLSNELNEKNLKFLESIGDYIFVVGEGNLDCARKVRSLESFVVN